jgi:hypothetical protein
MANGGLAAIMFDLPRADLKGFQPRQIIETEALRKQQLGMSPLEHW